MGKKVERVRVPTHMLFKPLATTLNKWLNNLKKNNQLRPTSNVPFPRATKKSLTGDQNTNKTLLPKWKKLKLPRKSLLSSFKKLKNKPKMLWLNSQTSKRSRLVWPTTLTIFKPSSNAKASNLPTLTRSNVTLTKIWLPKLPSTKNFTQTMKTHKKITEISQLITTSLSSHTKNPKALMINLRRNGRTSRTKTLNSPTKFPLVESLFTM